MTGGAGYVGSHTAKRLRALGYLPVVYDDLSSGHRWAIRYGRLVRGTLSDLRRLTDVVTALRPRAALHFAASAEVEDSVRNPERYFRNNVVTTLNLVAALRAARCGRLVFSSSAAVYGRPPRRLATERDPLQPINPYGESKLMCERILDWCAPREGFRFVSFRYFNAAGADPDGELGEIHSPEKHLIPNLLRFAGGVDRRMFLFGTRHPTPDGTCIRDFVHVADLAEAHARAIGYLDDGGDSVALNLGTGVGHSVREIVRLAAHVVGHDLKPTEAPARPGDPPILVADPREARRRLDVRPAYSDPETIIRTAWRWYRETGFTLIRGGGGGTRLSADSTPRGSKRARGRRGS